MTRWTRALYLWAALFACQRRSVAYSSIHQVQGKSTGCKFTERMFADGHGPFGMGGHSTITINATIAPLGGHEVTDTITLHRLRDYFDFGVVAITYTNVDRFADVDEHTVCNRDFSNPEEGNVEGVLHGAFYRVNNEDELHIASTFHPKNNGLQIVMLVPCWKQKSESFGYPVSATEYSMYPMKDALFSMEASISFRNPYGYLPALLYGLFPFSGALSLLYGFADLCFLILINRHREQALRIQYMLLVVLVLATGEAIAWFFTYKLLNESGQRVCCPYPPMIVFSTVVKIVAGMVARIITTLICLGYGIVRPTISPPEVAVVAGLGLCYSISVGALEISHLLNQSDGETNPPAVWEFLVIATNTCFAGWIFTSLALTRKNLAQFGQTTKLRMYTSLRRVLYGYVLVSFFLMGLEGAVYAGSLLLDWQHVWLIWAANRLLMFVALLVITMIWRPQSTSLLYARMDQVLGEEPRTPGNGTHGIELLPVVPCAMDEPTPRGKEARSVGANTKEEGEEEEPESERMPTGHRVALQHA